MSYGEGERIIERLIGRLSTVAVRAERDGYQGIAAERRQEVRALEQFRWAWGDNPDHIVTKQIETEGTAGRDSQGPGEPGEL